VLHRWLRKGVTTDQCVCVYVRVCICVCVRERVCKMELRCDMGVHARDANKSLSVCVCV